MLRCVSSLADFCKENSICLGLKLSLFRVADSDSVELNFCLQVFFRDLGFKRLG
jgi:hypothetical protein